MKIVCLKAHEGVFGYELADKLSKNSGEGQKYDNILQHKKFEYAVAGVRKRIQNKMSTKYWEQITNAALTHQ